MVTQIVVMGPSGSGKSLVGAALAARLRARFIDGDDLHPPANVAKMRGGTPLDDADRMPWLAAVGHALASGDDVIVACSALRRGYRDAIRATVPGVWCVELVVAPVQLKKRMSRREHFMPAALLDSQLALLDPLAADEFGIRVANDAGLDDVVERIASLWPGTPDRARQSLR